MPDLWQPCRVRQSRRSVVQPSLLPPLPRLRMMVDPLEMSSDDQGDGCPNCAALQDQIDAMTEDMREMQSELRYLR